MKKNPLASTVRATLATPSRIIMETCLSFQHNKLHFFFDVVNELYLEIWARVVDVFSFLFGCAIQSGNTWVLEHLFLLLGYMNKK